mmetsp:Transcript_46706/g.150049  ORF Transcript_46706/g.150049 Transcript_46706/m.150049 type:complete len:266 (+) Transcript_46706:1319-2116(+)
MATQQKPRRVSRQARRDSPRVSRAAPRLRLRNRPKSAAPAPPATLSGDSWPPRRRPSATRARGSRPRWRRAAQPRASPTARSQLRRSQQMPHSLQHPPFQQGPLAEAPPQAEAAVQALVAARQQKAERCLLAAEALDLRQHRFEKPPLPELVEEAPPLPAQHPPGASKLLERVEAHALLENQRVCLTPVPASPPLWSLPQARAPAMHMEQVATGRLQPAPLSAAAAGVSKVLLPRQRRSDNRLPQHLATPWWTAPRPCTQPALPP